MRRTRPSPIAPEAETPAARLARIPFAETRAPEPPGPPLAALSRGDARRWLAHWVAEPLQGGLNLATHQTLRLLPSPACSAVGARLSGLARRRFARTFFARRIADNLARLRPDLATRPAEARWWANTGRVYAEYSRLDKMVEEDRVEIVGRAHLDAARAGGRPVILVSVHLGPFELGFATVLRALGLPICTVYQPEPNRFSNRILHRVRARYGLYAFPPGQRSARHLYRHVAGGGDAMIYIDEVRDFQTHVPLFGRPPPRRGNAMVALKLARAANALVLPVHLLRTRGARFRFTIGPPFALSHGQGPADLAADVARLADHFEPLVRAHIEQWYMLPELRLPPG